MPKSKQIIRLAYASQSTSGVHELKDHLTSIVTSAQQHNARHNICGVLCFGNGYFFQFIEGYRPDIERLYQSIQNDKRHCDITLLASYPIEKSIFYGWSMKYVRLDEGLQNFLSEHQLLPFHPLSLSTETIDKLIEHLSQYADQSDVLGLPRLTQNNQLSLSDTVTRPETAQSGLIMMMIILMVGLVALALMGFTSLSLAHG